MTAATIDMTLKYPDDTEAFEPAKYQVDEGDDGSWSRPRASLEGAHWQVRFIALFSPNRMLKTIIGRNASSMR